MNIEPNLKAVIYCRVSSKEQEETGYSLPAQEKFLRDYAEKNCFDVAKAFSVSESARGKTVRKIFNKMMEFAEKNKITVIIVETTDRLTRNFADVPIIDDWIMKDENHQIYLAKEGCVLHKSSKSHEWFMWRVKVATAEYYVRLLSENVKKGQKEKLSQGYFPQKAPVGYKSSGDKGHKIHIIDEEKALLVKKMFELFDTGNYSIKKLAEVMYGEGLRNENDRKIGKSRMHEYLSNPFYYGKMEWNDQIYDGKQKPLISKGLFMSVQSKLRRKGEAPQYKKHLPVFKAKIRCEECGSVITWYNKKGHWYGSHNIYKECSIRKRGCIRQEEVEKQLFPYFDKVAPKNIKVLKWLEGALKENHANEIDYNTQKREELNRIIKLADERMEKSYRDKLDDKMPVVLCEKIIADSDKEKKDALESLVKLGKSRVRYFQAGYAIHELAMHAQEVYESEKATTEDRRLLLSMIFSNLGLNEGKIGTNYTKGFDFIANWAPKLNFTFEPAKMEDFTNKTSDFSPVSPEFIAKLRR